MRKALVVALINIRVVHYMDAAMMQMPLQMSSVKMVMVLPNFDCKDRKECF